MTRLLAPLGLLVMMASAGCGQDALVSWQFDNDGDSQGWMATHAVAPLVVSGGTLKTKIIGGDPYMNVPIPARRLRRQRLPVHRDPPADRRRRRGGVLLGQLSRRRG